MSSILIVEDDPKIRANLQFQLRQQGLVPSVMENAEAALAALTDREVGGPDLLLLDVRLPGMSGVDLVRALAKAERLPPTIIVSGEASITETVEAVQLGVHDFIEKPFTRERLMQSIKNALEHTALRREVAELRAEVAASNAILGNAPSVEALREQIARAAPTDGRVLIRGESGTGKELVANALHEQSPRHNNPFIKINCAAIPTQLIESELFGHAKGAFTDARAAKAGLFEEADGGTLFLDEIGDMDMLLQARLLRVLEDGLVRRVGESRDRSVDVRVIAATHCDLEGSVRSGAFREDLYFRLAHLPISVPALRDRGRDIRRLFDHFLARFTQRHRARVRRVDEDVYTYLTRYPWPGNVRELRALCERLVVFGTDPLTVEQLPSSFFANGDGTEGRNGETGLVHLSDAMPNLTLRAFKAQCEKEFIERMLHRTDWNVTAAARLLDIRRTYLHQKMANLGIRRPSPSALTA